MAFAITLNFDYQVNASLQIGDDVYHSMPQSAGGFEVVNVDNGDIITHIGKVLDIPNPFIITVVSKHVCTGVGVPVGCAAIGDPIPGIMPPPDSYISFSKDRRVNNNDLLGYYAAVNFKNNSTSEAKLFSIGSEVSENSK